MSAPSTGITAAAIQDFMPPYHLSADLLEDTLPPGSLASQLARGSRSRRWMRLDYGAVLDHPSPWRLGGPTTASHAGRGQCLLGSISECDRPVSRTLPSCSLGVDVRAAWAGGLPNAPSAQLSLQRERVGGSPGESRCLMLVEPPGRQGAEGFIGSIKAHSIGSNILPPWRLGGSISGVLPGALTTPYTLRRRDLACRDSTGIEGFVPS